MLGVRDSIIPRRMSSPHWQRLEFPLVDIKAHPRKMLDLLALRRAHLPFTSDLIIYYLT